MGAGFVLRKLTLFMILKCGYHHYPDVGLLHNSARIEATLRTNLESSELEEYFMFYAPSLKMQRSSYKTQKSGLPILMSYCSEINTALRIIPNGKSAFCRATFLDAIASLASLGWAGVGHINVFYL